ncbi:hypothetical protein IGI04_004751 [Brassica rapa subsp. trilocularis]|uniref:Uncharacterized protein n=1 Tax=Brassica rapa subsp. trilocularis TaxID=1813537 RepID=A0ABQ7NC02_BRACM|nr:hypothetical protein IGI04_004751 [Brassica rapa subsp. trilocularis]
MVIKRRFSHVFDFSTIPKAPRSTRRKVLSSKNDGVDDIRTTAIDLLASLAVKLLEESESSSTSSTNAFVEGKGNIIKQEDVEDDDVKPCESELASKSPPSDITSETSLEKTRVSDCERGLGLKPCGNKKEDCDDITEETGVDIEKREVKTPPGTDGVLNQSKLVCRDDDDENYCKYYRFSDRCRRFNRPLTRVGHRRMMTKYGRAVPRDTRTGYYHVLFDASFVASALFLNSTCGYMCLDGCLLYRKRKLCNGYNPWRHETVHRKRRLSDGGLSSESVTNSPQKGESVKFSIKSFRIPELFIEVPDTATVGSLKRTVMEAVAALLGDGIRIGVLVQGKKVRDDSNTLSQTGLSCRENLSNLGFTLEPGHIPLCSESPVISTPTDCTNLSERSLDSRIPFHLQDADHVISSKNCVENNQELVPYQSDISADEPSSDSRALVPVSSLEPDALAIVPLNEKSKRTEVSQRRTRRPFSVAEVEALVAAVEELGTGRWRDVKLRSFDDASHRTYVDLKDKWKTLVHTASISPQQRRGEPVPQELLDRVLAAHRCWSQHQLKQNGKLQAAATMVGSSM